MKNFNKIISLFLLIAFFSLLGFTLIVDNVSHDKYSSHTDCFGATCGPVEHVVIHDYIIEQIEEKRENMASKQKTLIVDETPPQKTYLSLESPPPKFSLV